MNYKNWLKLLFIAYCIITSSVMALDDIWGFPDASIEGQMFLGSDFNLGEIDFGLCGNLDSACVVILPEDFSSSPFFETDNGFEHIMQLPEEKVNIVDGGKEHEVKANSVAKHNNYSVSTRRSSFRPFKASEALPFIINTNEKKINNSKTHRKLEYPCDSCDKIFDQLSTLRSHKRVHTGEKPFVCEVCQRKFSEKTSLKNHLVRHSGAKKFTCFLCEMSFTTKQNLNRHMDAHAGLKKYSCPTCQQVFGQAAHVKTHRETFEH